MKKAVSVYWFVPGCDEGGAGRSQHRTPLLSVGGPRLQDLVSPDVRSSVIPGPFTGQEPA